MKVYVPKLKMVPIVILVLMFVLKNSFVIRNSLTLTSILDNLEWVVYILLICAILFSGYRIKQLLLIGIIALLLGICYLSTGQADLMKACIIIVYLNGVKEHEVFTQLYQAFMISFIIVLILYIFGISDAGIGRRNGLTLGFTTTNIASRMIQCILFSWALSKHNSIKFIKLFFISEMVSILILITTGSRLSALITAVLPFLIRFINFLLYKNKDFILKLLSLTPILFFIITVVLSYQYENNTYIQLLNSTILSNRIYMNYVAFDNFGFGLLGQTANISSLAGIFDNVSSKYINFLTIDSQYTYLAVYYGFIGTGIWMIANLMTFYKALKEKNAIVIAVLLLLNVYALTETMGSIFAFIPLMYLLVKTDCSLQKNYSLNIKHDINFMALKHHN